MHANLRLPLLLIAGAFAFSGGPARSEAEIDWRYCLAVSETARSIYISLPFQANAPVDQLEKAYGEFLVRRGLPHDTPVCPRSRSEQEALMAREDAIAFNRGRGLVPAGLTWRYSR